MKLKCLPSTFLAIGIATPFRTGGTTTTGMDMAAMAMATAMAMASSGGRS